MAWQAVTRKYDGQVWQPEERIDRVQALKMFSSWAAEYVRKPDQLGSLEVGKFADLLIIDRDYFTVRVDDILKIRPLMSVVGGEMECSRWDPPMISRMTMGRTLAVRWSRLRRSSVERRQGTEWTESQPAHWQVKLPAVQLAGSLAPPAGPV